jgi:hypothetical protein
VIGADIPHADVVTEDDDDVGFLRGGGLRLDDSRSHSHYHSRERTREETRFCLVPAHH